MMRWTTEVADHLAQKESSLPPPGQLCNRDWRVQKRATHSAHHSDGRDGSSFNSWMTARTPLSQLSAMQIRLPSGNRTAKGVGWQKQRQQLREGGRERRRRAR